MQRAGSKSFVAKHRVMAAASSHEWERGAHAWEVDSDFGDGHHEWEDSDSDDDIDWNTLSPEQSGDELADRLLSMLNRGALTAKAVCIISYFAFRAGALGYVKKLAHNPEAPSGHFQRHLDTVLAFSEEHKRLYELSSPGHNRHDKDRVNHRIWAMPLHEALANEVAGHPEIKTKVKSMVENRELSDDYYEHPVTRAHPEELVHPLSLYLDGIAHSKVDSVLGITISNLATGTRHLCVGLRKSILCRCGCRGWCTLLPIWSFIHWCLTAAADGFPRFSP